MGPLYSSTFVGPIELTATSTLMGSKLCTAKNGMCTRTIRKTADETVNNSATLQNDDQLFLAMAANETWFFTASIGHVGNTTADFSMTFTVPTGATIRWGCSGAKVGTGGGVGLCTFNATGDPADEFGSETITGRSIVVTGVAVNGANAGNLQLQWAQTVATVVDTKVLTNSYLEAHK